MTVESPSAIIRSLGDDALNLLLLEVAEAGALPEVTLSGTRAAHLIDVLKVTQGQTVRIGIIDGPIGTGVVTSVGDRTVTLQCVMGTEMRARPRVDLLLALPRPKVMRRLWAQVAAIGVGQILLTNAERVERNYFDTHVLTPEVYRPLLIEGLQQARDTRLPAVSIHRQFRILLEDDLDALFPGGTRIVADPGGEARIDEVARHAPGRVLLAVGPEGGWNAFELALMKAHGFQTIGLGDRTLRLDTACVALLAMFNDALH